MQSRRIDLPTGWVVTTIGEISDVNKRKQVLRDYPDEMLVSFVPMAAVDANQGVIASPQIRQLGEVRKGFTTFSNGDVIIAKITPSMENGKAAIAKNLFNGIGTGSTEFHVMSPGPNVLTSYLFYYVRQESFRWDAKANFTGTAGQLRVPGSFIEKYPIPLPPLPDQGRIVERIESLFTQLDAGVAGLKRLKKVLKRYKASVLTAACEGRFDKRNNNHPTELPIGWVWTTINELKNHLTTGSRGWAKYYTKSGSLFIRVGNFNRLSTIIDLGKIVFVTAPQGAEADRTRLKINDLLITMTADVGMVGIVDERIMRWGDAYINQHVGLVRLQEPDYVNFIAYALASEIGQKQFRSKQYGATKVGLNFDDINSLKLPLPPIEEQHRIAADIDQRLSVVQELNQTIEENLKRAARMRQAILKRSFDGKLV